MQFFLDSYLIFLSNKFLFKLKYLWLWNNLDDSDLIKTKTPQMLSI